MSEPKLIAIDWGSSNFRAFLVDEQGTVLKKRFAKLGILKVPQRDYATVFNQQLGDWLVTYAALPILMSGMIGSRQGWLEVPYVKCPATVSALAQGLRALEHQNKKLWIVPGVMYEGDDEEVDVMRGEEVQIMGALQHEEKQIFCLPGTHCKWATAEQQQIKHFATYMTGELFTVLARHSILAKLIQGNHLNHTAFTKGLKCGEKSAALTSQLFQVRAQVLAGKIINREVHSFLSGLLISHEVKHATVNLQQPVILVANPRVSELYAKALHYYKLEAIITDVDQITAKGLFKVAQLAGLLA